LIKIALKEWHVSHTQNLPRKINALKDRMAALNGKGETAVLTDEECVELLDISSNIHSLS